MVSFAAIKIQSLDPQAGVQLALLKDPRELGATAATPRDERRRTMQCVCVSEDYCAKLRSQLLSYNA